MRRLLRCTSTRKVDASELGMSMEQLEEDRAELAQMMGADDEDRDDVGTEDLEHTLLDPFGYVRTFELLLKDAEFAAVICDEGHAIRNARSSAHNLVALIKRDSTALLSATPMLNSVRDLLGYITLFWNGPPTAGDPGGDEGVEAMP